MPKTLLFVAFNLVCTICKFYSNSVKYIYPAFLSFVLFSMEATGQTDSFRTVSQKSWHSALLLGYNYNNNPTVEIGLVRGHRCNYTGNCEMIAEELFYTYMAFSSEIGWREHLFVCPKVGGHLVLTPFHLGVSALTYTDFTNVSLGARPEIGLSFGGVLSVCYGRNYLTSRSDFNVSKNNLSVKIVFGSKFLK